MTTAATTAPGTEANEAIVHWPRGIQAKGQVNEPDAAERHETQYFEMFGNRGIDHKGWTAVTKHRTPWETGAEVQTPARAASSRPRPSCSRPTRPWTSATSSARR